MLALLDQKITIDRYVAYEIDKFAIKASIHNFPNIEHRGDVFEADFTEFIGFDYLMGGSPCTHWSIAKNKNREVKPSGFGWELFLQFERALREAQPRYFIYENNKSMSPAIKESITRAFGFEPICINSALLSAQNRERLYWVGKKNIDGTYSKVDINQPSDKGILLKNVLDHSQTFKELSEKEMDYMVRGYPERRWGFASRPGERDKSRCVTANIHKGVPYNVVCVPIYLMNQNDMGEYTIYEVADGNIIIKEKKYPIKLSDGYYIIRKHTVRECMRLQTIPEWYDFSVVSETRAFRMIGNGWTVSIISFLLSHIKS